MIASTRLELGAGELEVEVLRAGGIGGDERQVDLGLHRRARELDLRLLRRFLQALQGHRILAEVDALLLLELLEQPLDDLVVDVVAAEVGVAVGGLDLDDALAHFEDRDVEGAAAEVVDRDRLVLLLVEAVGERRGRRLVDDALDVEAGDLAGVLGGLALGVVEVGRDGDDRLGHLLAQVVFGRLLQLAEDHRGDLGRRVQLAAIETRQSPFSAFSRPCRAPSSLLAFDFVELAAHEALHREDGVAPGWSRPGAWRPGRRDARRSW
jgi:hypothetical protein